MLFSPQTAVCSCSEPACSAYPAAACSADSCSCSFLFPLFGLLPFRAIDIFPDFYRDMRKSKAIYKSASKSNLSASCLYRIYASARTSMRSLSENSSDNGSAVVPIVYLTAPRTAPAVMPIYIAVQCLRLLRCIFFTFFFGLFKDLPHNFRLAAHFR